MPTICHFYGIIIVMYQHRKEHEPPHIHAVMQDYDVPVSIATGEVMVGDFPKKARAMVKEFVLKNQRELEEMWETGTYRRLPPV